MKTKYIETGRKKQKQKTRQKILTSAKSFLKQGTDFTLEQVAEDANISRATVYRYFSNVEVLSLEAGLDWQTKSPESIIKPLEYLETIDIVKGIQEYFNTLTYKNEKAFRKYLSHAITCNTKEGKRGARRVKTIELALLNDNLNVSKDDLEKFKVVATLLMGVEAMIVTKDVCGLNNYQSNNTLKWGLEKLFLGVLNDNNS